MQQKIWWTTLRTGRLGVCVTTGRPGLEIMSFWPSKSLERLFSRQVVNKQHALFSSVSTSALLSSQRACQLTLHFLFIFRVLSLYFISTFFYFTVLHTDSTSASSLTSSAVQTRRSSALWQICKSTQTFFFFLMIVRHGFIPGNTYFQRLGLSKVCIRKKNRSLDPPKCVALCYDNGVHVPDILIIILSSFFSLALCTLYICINVTACNHFLCHRRLI